MRTVKFFLVLMMVSLLGAQVNAQGNSQNNNGNAVISQMDVFENESGMGEIYFKISGNQASDFPTALVKIQGASIPGGTYTVYLDNSRYFNPEPEFSATFPLLPQTGNQPDHVVVTTELYCWHIWCSEPSRLPARDRIVARRRRGQ